MNVRAKNSLHSDKGESAGLMPIEQQYRAKEFLY